jgi:hypothetical protein
MDEHGTALVYDLRRLGVDIRDLWRDDSELSPRYVLMLVEHLDDSSALSAAHRGGREFRPWTTQVYLLAAVANLLNAANRQRAGKGTRKPLIEPPKRQVRARRITVAELLAKQPGLAA